MTLARSISFLGLAGILLVIFSEGFYFRLNPDTFSVAVDPLSIIAWLLMFIAILVSLSAPVRHLNIRAGWLRCSLAFIIDSSLLVSCLIIPFCLGVLVSENDGVSFYWQIVREPGLKIDHIYSSALMLIVLVIWSGIGLCLHPKVTTPGALMANIVLGIEEKTPLWRLLIFGGFAYFGIFISFFTIFASDVRAVAWLRNSE